MRPKISVIVPIYNAELYLEQCIESVLNQTLRDIELLLIDDGSTDNSFLICEKYKKRDNRIQLYTNKNVGQGLERNFGIKKSTGEYIAFLDSDDQYKENMLEKLYQRAIETNADMVSCLKKYLRKEYDNLYTLDLICHGVPSSELLNAFLKGKEKLYSSQITELKFREKAYGWRNQELYIKFENGRIYHAPIWVDNFYRLFTNNYILRDSCYSCKFSSMERQGDITIGDFWNIKNANETFEDKLGVSSVIINSEKGKKIFETVKNEFDIIECSLNDINQKNLNSPSPKPVHYEDFQRLIAEKGFEYCLKKYGSMKMLEKIRRALSPVKQRLKAMLRH